MAGKSSLRGVRKMHPPQASEKRQEFDPYNGKLVCIIKYSIRGGGRSPAKPVSGRREPRRVGENSLGSGKLSGNSSIAVHKRHPAGSLTYCFSMKNQPVESKFPKRRNRE